MTTSEATPSYKDETLIALVWAALGCIYVLIKTVPRIGEPGAALLAVAFGILLLLYVGLFQLLRQERNQSGLFVALGCVSFIWAMAACLLMLVAGILLWVFFFLSPTILIVRRMMLTD